MSATFRLCSLFPFIASLPAFGSFELNLGQADRAVSFFYRGDGTGVFLTEHYAVFAATGRPVVRMTWRGANADSRWEAGEALPGRVYYSSMRGCVPTYLSVVRRGLYPGIDLVFRESTEGAEYDFVLHPGADPRRIRLGFDAPVEIEGDGGLCAGLSARTSPGVAGKSACSTSLRRPVLFQVGEGGRRTVRGEFSFPGRGEIGFEVGDYDRNRELVIDPLIIFSNTFQPRVDGASPALLDRAGNSYITGQRTMVDAGTGIGGTPKMSIDGVVTKIAPDGNTVLFTTYIRNGPVAGVGIGPDGIVVIAGSAFNDEAGIAATPGGFQTDGGPGFVAKLAPGGGVAWVARLNARPAAVASDPLGNLYVTGAAGSTFRTTPGSYKPAIGESRCSDRYGSVFFGCDDAFVVKIHPDGKSLFYATFLGGSWEDSGTAIAADVTGSAFVTGKTNSADFPITPGAFQTGFGGRIILGPLSYGDAFAARLDPSGSGLIYGTYLGGAGADTATGLAIDSDQAAYVTGSSGDPAKIPSPTGDVFAVKLNQRGEGLWSTRLTSTIPANSGRIAVSPFGHVYVSASGPIISKLENHPPALCDAGVAVISLDTSTGLIEGLQGLRAATAPVLAPGGDGVVAALAQSLTPGELLLSRIDFTKDTRLALTCVVNSGSLQAQPAVSPGELVSVRGVGLQGAVLRLGGVQLPIFYSGDQQAGAMIPYDTPLGSSTLTIEQGDERDAMPIRVARVAPGVFTVDGSGTGAAAAVNEDGTFNSAEHPAPRGSLVSFYATGFGPLTPLPPLVAPLSPPFPVLAAPAALYLSAPGPAGATGAEIVYAGASTGQVSGLLQINARIPADATSGRAYLRFVLGPDAAAERTQDGVFVYTR